MAKPGIDRRSECRYDADIECTIRFKERLGLVEHHARLCDLSVRGARVRTSVQVPKNTLVVLTLPKWANYPIYAQVVHSTKENQPEGMLGLRIIEGTIPFRIFQEIIGDAQLHKREHKIPECFRLLGLPFPSAADRIHAAFRERARVVHPDHGGSERDFIQLHAAFQEALALSGET